MAEALSDRAAADAVAAALTTAWNAADGAAFAREFTDDADFVNIFAMHGVGREAIAEAHQMIFDTIYRGSRNAFSVEAVRSLRDDVALAHIRALLEIPEGPMQGELRALATAVMVREGEAWKIAAFHNTKEGQLPSRAT